MNEQKYQTFKVMMRNMGPQNAVEVRAMAASCAKTFTLFKWLSIPLLVLSLPLSLVVIGIPPLFMAIGMLIAGIVVPKRYRAYGERYISEHRFEAERAA